MSAHTPGPWFVEDVGDGALMIVADLHLSTWDQTHVAEAFTTDDCGGTIHKTEAEANARLIAAAPELLDAVKVARNHLRCKVTGEWLNPAGWDTACECVSCADSRVIEAAIASAEGR